MSKLHELREIIRVFYGKYTPYINASVKGLTALLMYVSINIWLNFSKPLQNPFLVLLLGLFSAVLPWKFISLISVFLILLHLKVVSIWYVGLVGMTLLLMFLIYFHFSVEKGMLLVITPLLFFLNIPYVIPIAVGLIGKPTDCLGLAFGIVFYHLLAFAKGNIIPSTDKESELQNVVESVIEAGKYIFKNPTMILYITVFSAVLIIVYLIKRLPIRHSWFISIGAGNVLILTALLLGDYKLEVPIKPLSLFFGIFCSVLVNVVITFFAFNVEYAATESYQFEDEEYYYYVKAVPKISMSIKNRMIRRITTKTESSSYQTDDIEWERGASSGK